MQLTVKLYAKLTHGLVYNRNAPAINKGEQYLLLSTRTIHNVHVLHYFTVARSKLYVLSTTIPIVSVKW